MPVENVAAQFAPPIQSPMAVQNGLMQNALAQGQLQQNQLAIRQAQALDAQKQGVRNALQSGQYDLTNPAHQAQFVGQFPDVGPALVKTINEGQEKAAKAESDRASAGKATQETSDAALKTYRSILPMVKTPEQFGQWVDGMFSNPATAKVAQQFGTPEQIKARIPQDPAAFQDFLQQNAVGMDEFIKNKTTIRGQDLTAATSTENSKRAAGATVQSANIHAGATIGAAKIGAAASTSNNERTNQVHLMAYGLDANGQPTDATEAEAQRIAAGKQAPPTGVAALRPMAATVMKRVGEINPQFDSADWAAKQQAVKSFATGKDGQAIQSANTALNHLDTLRQLAAAQSNGDIQKVNEIKNAIAKQFGGVAPANLQAAVTLVGPEISKAVIGAGGGQGDREKVDAALSSLVKGNSAQQEGTLGTMEDLFGGRLTEAQRTYERTTKNTDFGQMLSPAAQKILAKKQGGSAHPPEITDLLKKYGK